jgi:hypothetical protein
MASPLHRIAAGWLALALALSAAPAEAQAPAPAGYRPATTRDDVPWEERRAPYDGGPIRPGGQLEGSISGWVWLGVAGFAGGFALSLVGVANGRSHAAIPLAGPWLALANVDGDDLQWEAGSTAAMVFAGLLQPAGIAVFVGGLLNPNLYVVYDAPVGRPSPFEAARLRLLPWAPGADVGVGLALEVF